MPGGKGAREHARYDKEIIAFVKAHTSKQQIASIRTGALVLTEAGILTGRNWIHFHLDTKDEKGEVERLLKLGATRHPQEYEPHDDFIVLEDGNLFCVVGTTK